MIKYKKIDFDIEKYFPQMVDFFSQEPKVYALYLFGSYARGSAGCLSDIDIAVLLAPNAVSQEDLAGLRLRLLRSAIHILRTEEVDLVILNICPPYLQYRVFKDGRLLFVRDNLLEQKFRERAISVYLDTKRIRDEYFNYLGRSFMQGEVENGYRSRKYQTALKRAQGLYR